MHSTQQQVLDGYKALIVDEIDGMALRLGRLLREAKQAAPKLFDVWVRDELPFGHETARRLMVVSAAYEKLPAEVTAELPRPWQALYAIKTLPMAALEAGIASGRLTPSTTVRESIQFVRDWNDTPLATGRLRDAEIAAGVLMQYPPTDLAPEIRKVLSEWLDRADWGQSEPSTGP